MQNNIEFFAACAAHHLKTSNRISGSGTDCLIPPMGEWQAGRIIGGLSEVAKLGAAAKRGNVALRTTALAGLLPFKTQTFKELFRKGCNHKRNNNM